MSGVEDWIGRTERRTDRIAAEAVDRLAATLDRNDPSARDGDPAPPLAHWLAFLPREPMRDLGPDGHARRGGFLPPVEEGARRMWAGSRLHFPGPLPIGAPLERESTVTAVMAKQGASGPLLFVTVRHAIGLPGAAPAVIDEHDIVYRGPSPSGSAPSSSTTGPDAGDQTGDTASWHRQLAPDPVLLFRYSALTFNGHRIHYDRPYATGTEGYPGLVVHGPLIATLLLDLARRERPGAGVGSFSFRAVSPLFDGERLVLEGWPEAQGARLEAGGPRGPVMRAALSFTSP